MMTQVGTTASRPEDETSSSSHAAQNTTRMRECWHETNGSNLKALEPIEMEARTAAARVSN